jgi:hypothetical protein
VKLVVVGFINICGITQHSVQSRKHLENIIYIIYSTCQIDMLILRVPLYLRIPFDGDYSQGVQGCV